MDYKHTVLGSASLSLLPFVVTLGGQPDEEWNLWLQIKNVNTVRAGPLRRITQLLYWYSVWWKNIAYAGKYHNIREYISVQAYHLYCSWAKQKYWNCGLAKCIQIAEAVIYLCDKTAI